MFLSRNYFFFFSSCQYLYLIKILVFSFFLSFYVYNLVSSSTKIIGPNQQVHRNKPLLSLSLSSISIGRDYTNSHTQYLPFLFPVCLFLFFLLFFHSPLLTPHTHINFVFSHILFRRSCTCIADLI